MVFVFEGLRYKTNYPKTSTLEGREIGAVPVMPRIDYSERWRGWWIGGATTVRRPYFAF